jgi:hypothetical protein
MKQRMWKKNTAKNSKMRDLLGRFVEEVVAPLLWAGEESGVANNQRNEDSSRTLGVIYQVKPTLRVHMPGQSHVVARHRDYAYKRQPTEVNVWLPLTAAEGANSLWVESKPGLEDFAPFQISSYGKAVLFWGNQCEHYTTVNTTDTTRVSLDLRVIRSDLYVPKYIAPATRRRFGAKAKPAFGLGMGYTSTNIEAAWRKAETGYVGHKGHRRGSDNGDSGSVSGSTGGRSVIGGGGGENGSTGGGSVSGGGGGENGRDGGGSASGGV